MDSWPPDPHQRHKRNYDEMSQHARMPSRSISFFGSFGHSPSPDNTPIFVERRRTSHPHNHQPPQPPRERTFTSAHEPMASHQPSLTHQASQTVIDLTDDAEEADQDAVAQSLMRRFPRRPPPQLGRSDGAVIEDIIDLTEDVDEELMITGMREIPAQPTRLASPGHHSRPRSHYERRGFMNAMRRTWNRQVGGALHPVEFMDHHRTDAHMHGPAAALFAHAQQFHPQQMPQILDYQMNAFIRAPIPAQSNKPAHEPPSDAKEGFTRSPTEDDTIICPGCEEELVAKKGEDDQPLPRKGNKVPSKKDREEHPFWVVKECGHVFCNKCFQHRKPDKRSVSSNFPEIVKETSKSKAKVAVCAVEGCESEISNKEKWVGVFI